MSARGVLMTPTTTRTKFLVTLFNSFLTDQYHKELYTKYNENRRHASRKHLLENQLFSDGILPHHQPHYHREKMAKVTCQLQCHR